MNTVNNFRVVIPAELSKSKDGEWKVRGLASTPSQDRQGEVILQEGMDLSPIDEKRGVLNFDHKNGPENIIGVIDGYRKTPQGLYIDGRLFKNHTKAKAVYEIMSSLGKSDFGRVGLSVEGKILERAGDNGNVIKRCQINAVAVTLNPVNQDSYVDLVKSMTESEIDFQAKPLASAETNEQEPTFTMTEVMQFVQKALSVGSGYADKTPSELSGGDALAQEALDEKPKKVEELKKKKLKKMCKSLYKSNMLEILNKLQELYPDNSRAQLWEAVKDRLNTRFPNMGVNADN